MKICSVCHEDKPLDEFHNSKASKDGRQGTCKPCARKRALKWYWDNHERGLANARAQDGTAKMREWRARPGNRERSAAQAYASKERRAGIITKFPTEKPCNNCGVTKAIEEFGKHRYARDGHQGRCRKCQSLTAMQWNKDHPEAFKRNARAHRMRKQFGLTIEEYDELFVRQNGRCGICERLPNPRLRLAVDHDHATGAVRGLLCHRCNSVLGIVEDDPETWATAAVAYLELAKANVKGNL